MTAREEIAAAATIDGLTNVTPYYRQTLTARQGFVRLVSRVRGDNGFGWIDTWQIWLALEQDVVKTEKWLEQHLSDLMAAVDQELVVTSAAPMELGLSTVVPGLIIAGTREG